MDFKRMLDYSAALYLHNERAWFHENHRQYELARGDFISLLDGLRFKIASAAPDLTADILPMQARDWVYRTAHDMRYRRNGPPYDPAFRAYISADRKSWRPIGYFLRIFPGSSCFGTGLWCESPDTLHRARLYAAEHSGELEAAERACGVPVAGDRLKRVPRGWEEDHPAAHWLKFRNWFVIEDIDDGLLTDFDSFGDHISGLTERMEPVRQILLRMSR